jgi:hypothetical protein
MAKVTAELDGNATIWYDEFRFKIGRYVCFYKEASTSYVTTQVAIRMIGAQTDITVEPTRKTEPR